MARTKRHPAWTSKASDFEGEFNEWWLRIQQRRYRLPIPQLVKVMNAHGQADGISRNAPKHYRQTLNRKFRAKQNQALRNAIIQSKDLDAIIIMPRSPRNANWMWF